MRPRIDVSVSTLLALSITTTLLVGSAHSTLVQRQHLTVPHDSAWCSAVEGEGFGRTLVLGDFDGDGRDDLAAWAESEIHFYYGQQDGSLDLADSMPSWYCRTFAAADLNDDGYDDLITADTGNLRVFYGGAGPYPFPPPAPYTPDWEISYSTGTGATVVATGDQNGDGIADLAVGYLDTSPNAFVVYGFDHLQGGDLDGPYPILHSDLLFAASNCGDLNQDGLDDAIFGLADGQWDLYDDKVTVRPGSRDRSLWLWGDNTFGQLGDGSLVDQSLPLLVTSHENWRAVAAGTDHSLARRARFSSLWAWGKNTSGQVGDGTTTDRLTPVQVLTDCATFAADGSSSYAIKSDGSLWAWGSNTYGQLGDGTTTNRVTPVQIGSVGEWQVVNAGSRHALAIKTDGSLWAWGHNGYGQLGDGTTTERHSPVQVITGSDTDWVAVDGGAYHSLALRKNGTMWAWGLNGYGELGQGNYVDSNTRMQVGTDSDWVRISAGLSSHFNLALKSDGSLWFWGTALGTASSTVPTQWGSDSDEDWAKISAGYVHVLALKRDGTLWASGKNNDGQLGIGNTTDQSEFVQVGTEQDWMLIDAGRFHSIALCDAVFSTWSPAEVPGITTTSFGDRVGGAGDINGDGHGDIVVSDPWYDGGASGGLGYWGRAYFWYGGPATPEDPSGLGVDPSAVTADEIISGAWDNGAARNFSAGDIDGDSIGDMVIGDRRGAVSCWDGEESILVESGDIRSYISGSSSNNSVAGVKWEDINSNGVQDAGDEGLQNWRIYVDANENSQYDDGEAYTYTGSDGAYQLLDLDPGTHTIAEELQADWTQTFPAGSGTHVVAFGGLGEEITGISFGNHQDAGSAVDDGIVLGTFALHPNIPNPFNAKTVIRYDLPKPCTVTLNIYDLSGRVVRTLLRLASRTAGKQEAIWLGRDDRGRSVASGIYFYRLNAGSFCETKRMVLAK